MEVHTLVRDRVVISADEQMSSNPMPNTDDERFFGYSPAAEGTAGVAADRQRNSLRTTQAGRRRNWASIPERWVVFRATSDHDRYEVHERHMRFIEVNRANWARVRVFDSCVQ